MREKEARGRKRDERRETNLRKLAAHEARRQKRVVSRDPPELVDRPDLGVLDHIRELRDDRNVVAHDEHKRLALRPPLTSETTGLLLDS